MSFEYANMFPVVIFYLMIIIFYFVSIIFCCSVVLLVDFDILPGRTENIADACEAST